MKTPKAKLSLREIDALIAEKVMGLKVKELAGYDGFGNEMHRDFYMFYGGDYKDMVPNYTTDIAQAFQVLDRLNTDGFEYRVGRERDGSAFVRLIDKYGKFHAWALDMPVPEAICRAVIAALGLRPEGEE